MSVQMHYRIIGENIRECRKNLDLTQEELAEQTGICHQFLGRIERGKSVPSLATIMSLCDALHVEPNRLLTRCATHDDNPPCRLRSEDAGFCEALSDMLLPATESPLMVIAPEDLPLIDFDLPDTCLDN